jgi:pimeloyl-ACP methyl ester carboxylesterase
MFASRGTAMTAVPQPSLAFDRRGTGVPIVLLPGLTFSRAAWRPIVERLEDQVSTIAVDLPAHGESAGPPCDLADVTVQVHELLESLGVADPIVVGHSMSGSVAMIYAATYPVRGAVSVDAGFDVRPFARGVQQLEPALRGGDFASAFAHFERSMGFELVPEPLRSVALSAQTVRQDVVLGYWDQLLRTDADALQAWVEELARKITAPCLAVFGRQLAADERAYVRRLVPHVRLEEWDGRGHFVHLAEADRFAARLRRFAAAV